MSKENIVKLCDEDLTEVCGGGDGDEFKKGFFGEAGKFCFAVVGAPIIAALTGMAVWGINRLTKKLDQKLDASKNKQPLKLPATVATEPQA